MARRFDSIIDQEFEWPPRPPQTSNGSDDVSSWNSRGDFSRFVQPDEQLHGANHYRPFLDAQSINYNPFHNDLLNFSHPPESRQSYSKVMKNPEYSQHFTESKSFPMDESGCPTISPGCFEDAFRREGVNEETGMKRENIETDARYCGWNKRPNDCGDGFHGTATTPKSGKSDSSQYWDPKRIFQPKKTKPAAEVLNNGKCPANSVHHTTKTDFINNDLRDRKESRKKSNEKPEKKNPKKAIPKEAQTSRPSTKSNSKVDSRSECTTETKSEFETKSRSESKTELGCDNKNNLRGEGRNESKDDARRKPEKSQQEKRSKHKEKIPHAWLILESWGRRAWELFWEYGWPALRFVPIVVIKVTLLLLAILLYYTIKGWELLKPHLNFQRFFKKKTPGGSSDRYSRSGPGAFGSGLDCNIVLPSTGTEAIQRLLDCQGKDPYCILGLHGACTDDDIKRYYRKQVVLVHPDKNRETGAEEAFKILQCAFEQIGSPEKRQIFDEQMHETKAAAEAARQFGDLLSNLKTKFREAANKMNCERCKGTHQRYPVERPLHEARYCGKCHEHHMAKEGDCWAEATLFRFYWKYYACMEGQIFNITEWASCQGDLFENMRPNSHHVIYTLGTSTNQRRSQQKPAWSATGGIDEKDLEDFFRYMATGGIPKDDLSSHFPGRGHQNHPGQTDSGKKRQKGKKRRR